MSAVTFNKATNADIDLLVDFMRQFYAIDHYPFDEQVARKALTGLIEDPALGRLWLIYAGEQTAGYVAVTFGYSLEFHGRNAIIDELFFLAEHRGKGLGTKTLDFVAQECRHLGVHALHLEVERGNSAGQTLYRKMGFTAHEQRFLMTRWLDR